MVHTTPTGQRIFVFDFQLEEAQEGKEESRRQCGGDVMVMRAGAGVGILI